MIPEIPSSDDDFRSRSLIRSTIRIVEADEKFYFRRCEVWFVITESPDKGDVTIVRGKSIADVYVDPNDHAVTHIAATDLCTDVERVTGTEPQLVNTLDAAGEIAVVVGTIDNSVGVDACLPASDIDAAELRGRRESYVIATVRNPAPDLDACVLVVGSDPRGTAYGSYDLSKTIGVSPWYWWADVAPTRRDVVAVEAGCYADGPPSVTYRGIFLNDEDFGLRPWATDAHAPDDSDRPGIGPTTYERLFELLLRLKANTVWPAMHPDTKAFYRYPEHADLADTYAIIVGTSHCEPMHRNNVDEWEAPHEEWNYETNRETILSYWRERVEDVADYENVFTLGMRGIHDSEMPGGDTREERTATLQRVIEDQRTLLDEAHDRSVDRVPQAFCPYKEVLELYRGGLDVPEDVCVMWPDDNYGHIRALPTEPKRERAGGHGVYYHLSYWGRPHDYLWLSSVPPGLVRREMTKAYDAGAREYWFVNVGDVKPTEKEMEYFLDLAWDVESVRETPIAAWLEAWADREFGERYAGEIADLLREYYRLSQSRKPEHMGRSTVYPNTKPDDPAFSVTHGGDEARRRVAAFERIADRATEICDTLPESRRPSFYELVGYPIRCAAAMTAKHIHAYRSRRYAGQGRATAEAYGDRAEAAHRRIAEETRYYNETLLDGKWAKMMSDRPRELPVFDEPDTASTTPHEGPSLGVVPEGCREPVRESDVHPPALPTVHPGMDRERFLDLFARGAEPTEWTATPSDDWIRLSAREGTVTDETRLWVGVDRTLVPETGAAGTITVEGYGTRKRVRVVASPRRETAADFAVIDGVAAMEAEHASRRRDGDRARWTDDDIPGRLSGTTVALEPSVFESYDPDEDGTPRLEFDLEIPSAETVTVDAYCVPTQALTEARDLRYAVDLGEDREIASIDPAGGEHDPEWQQNVLRGGAVGTTTHEIPTTGLHTLAVEGLDPGLIVDRIVVRTDARAETYLGPRETRLE